MLWFEFLWDLFGQWFPNRSNKLSGHSAEGLKIAAGLIQADLVRSTCEMGVFRLDGIILPIANRTDLERIVGSESEVTAARAGKILDLTEH